MNNDHSFHLFNTLSGNKEKLEAIDPKHLKIYACGPTVYNYAHIGNARMAVVFDTLVRTLREIYPKVTYVSNITDIDDKIIDAAKEQNVEITSITEKYTQIYNDDMAKLNVLAPDIQPKATEYISEMIELIIELIEKDFAYEKEGHVLFHVPSYSNYGKLSKRNKEEQIAGSRVEIAPFKKDPADFVLWKPSTEDQPGWKSPWGIGRPGWHTECSAMSKKTLGLPFDIHGGGRDLIFPHHENEIAQSCCSTANIDEPSSYAKYWMHNGFVTINGEKMAKSLGNIILVKDLAENYHGEVIRLAMLMTHYRQPLNWTENSLLESKKILNKWFSFFLDIEISKVDEDFVDESILSALKDDINTPKAISELHQLFKNCTKEDVLSIKKFINSARLLGLMLSSPKEWMEWNVRENNLDEIKINELIEKRNLLRDQGNYSDADKIRDQLDELEIILEDKDGKTTWKQKN